MDRKEKFNKFLESLKGHNQDTLIENVQQGFQACFENRLGQQVHPEDMPESIRRSLSGVKYSNPYFNHEDSTLTVLLPSTMDKNFLKRLISIPEFEGLYNNEAWFVLNNEQLAEFK